jgi:hypothetical protein
MLANLQSPPSRDNWAGDCTGFDRVRHNVLTAFKTAHLALQMKLTASMMTAFESSPHHSSMRRT